MTVGIGMTQIGLLDAVIVISSTNSSHFYVYFCMVIAAVYLWEHNEHEVLYLYLVKDFRNFDRIFVG